MHLNLDLGVSQREEKFCSVFLIAVSFGFSEIHNVQCARLVCVMYPSFEQ